MPSIRLQKILSAAGLASRRQAEALIAGGRVFVNGHAVLEPGTRADPATDKIVVNGTEVRLPERKTYILMYKPRGYVSTMRDPQRRRTVLDLLPPGCPRVFHVGRLDIQTEGLLILTDDGAFAERISHPRHGCEKVYLAKVSGVPAEEALLRLRRGIVLDGQRTAPARVQVVHSTRRDGNTWVALTLTEGRSREVRRMMQAIGHEVSKLRRVRIGPIDAKGLVPGSCRALRRSEIKALERGSEPAESNRKGLDLPKTQMRRIVKRTKSTTRNGQVGQPRAARPTGDTRAPSRFGKTAKRTGTPTSHVRKRVPTRRK